MDKVKYAVIGAGVVGLAIARELSLRSDGDVVVLEKNPAFGQETSSRNSEVIHAGLYYPPNSLKSVLCRSGNKMLYDFCTTEDIPFSRCGKLVVSTNDTEAQKISSIYDNAVKAGVPALELIDKQSVQRLEPSIYAINAMLSNTTGIIDSHSLMKKLHDKAISGDAMFSFSTQVKAISRTADGYVISYGEEEILAENVINSAGLFSDKIAQIAGLDIDALGYTLYHCKGDYFSVACESNKLKRLVYPVPHEKGHGLGVHATLNLAGFIRLGPDTEYVEKIRYDIDALKSKDFYNAAKTYLPWIKEDMLAPDTSGMRPKLQGPVDGFRDFVIKEESDNGLPGFVNLIGIESPGLTGCLAIAKMVSKLLASA